MRKQWKLSPLPEVDGVLQLQHARGLDYWFLGSPAPVVGAFPCRTLLRSWPARHANSSHARLSCRALTLFGRLQPRRKWEADLVLNLFSGQSTPVTINASSIGCPLYARHLHIALAFVYLPDVHMVDYKTPRSRSPYGNGNGPATPRDGIQRLPRELFMLWVPGWANWHSIKSGQRQLIFALDNPIQ